MRSTSILASLLLLSALPATTFARLNLLPDATNPFNTPEFVSIRSTPLQKRPLMVESVPLNLSVIPPPEPFSTTYRDLVVVLSKYGQPIPIAYFAMMYVRCLWDIWNVVAHSQNAYQPPEVRPLDGPSFIYQNDVFRIELRQASSAVVDWEYVELYNTLNLLIGFAFKYGMREMDIEVVTAGVGAFGGVIRYSGPPEALR